MVCENRQKLLSGHNYFSHIKASLPDVFIKGVVCGGNEICKGICWVVVVVVAVLDGGLCDYAWCGDTIGGVDVGSDR